MEAALPVQDELNLNKKKEIIKHLSESNSKLFWSERMNKVNRQGRSQARVFALTSKNLLNMGNAGFFTSIKAMRVMDLKKINNVTYSIMGQSIVLHLDDDYDYYLNGGKRDELIEYILTLREGLGCPTINLGLSNNIDLMDYVKIRTMERDPKKCKTQKTVNAA